MSPINDELKNALRRQEPPHGFADRVLARLADEKSEHLGPASRSSVSRSSTFGILIKRFSTQPFLHWATAAALAVVLIAGAIHYRQIHRLNAERAAGKAAKQRLVLALHIASSKLQLAKTKVKQTTATQMRSGEAEN
jgi:hypothetical protein